MYCDRNQRVRTNIVLLKPIKLYLPDDDDSVPHAFAQGRKAISTAKGCRDSLLSGYLSALCAVLPELTKVAKNIIEDLGCRAQEISVPLQANGIRIKISQVPELKLECLMFAQIYFLPFQTEFSEDSVKSFWCKVAGNAGIERSPLMLCSARDMETISSALSMSGMKRKLQSGIGSSRHALADTNKHIDRIIVEALRLMVNMSPYDRNMYRRVLPEMSIRFKFGNIRD